MSKQERKDLLKFARCRQGKGRCTEACSRTINEFTFLFSMSTSEQEQVAESLAYDGTEVS